MAKKPREKFSPQKIEKKARFAAYRVNSLKSQNFPGRELKVDEWKSKAHSNYSALADYYGKRSWIPGAQKKEKMYRKYAEKYALIAPLEKGKALEIMMRKYSPMLSVVFLGASLLLVIFNLTGYAIGGAEEGIKFAGVVSFLLGLVFAFLYLRTRR